MIDLPQLAQAVIDGMADDAGSLTRSALAGGIGPGQVLEEGLLAGMRVVGERFRDGQMFLPDVLASARAMKAGMDLLEPLLSACGVEPIGTVVIGTVKGDIHDIGKNLVAVMLRGAGFRVIDIGANAPADSFLAAAAEHRPQILAMSALLTTTMLQMERNMAAFRAAGLLERVRVLVGGAAVTRRYAESIGAEYAANASDAVTCAFRIVGEAAVGASD